MITLKRYLWGFLWMPQSHIRRRAVGGTLQSQVLLCSPHHLPGARIKPGYALASGRVSGGFPAAPRVASTASTALLWEGPRAPEHSLGDLQTVGWELPLAGCLLPEVLCPTPPHPNCRLLPLPLLCQSPAQKRALPQSPPPEFSPELKTLSCTQIPEGSGTQLMLNLGLSLQMLASLT